MRLVPPEELESPHLRALVGWYESARSGGGWPPREAFRPETLAPATLPYIGLVEVQPEPFRVLYRVLGSALAASMGGGEVRLRYLDELDWPQRGELEALWRQVYAEASPRFLRGTQIVERMSFVFESCALPVGSPADPARRYLVGEDYLGTEAWRGGLARRGYRLGG